MTVKTVKMSTYAELHIKFTELNALAGEIRRGLQLIMDPVVIMQTASSKPQTQAKAAEVLAAVRATQEKANAAVEAARASGEAKADNDSGTGPAPR